MGMRAREAAPCVHFCERFTDFVDGGLGPREEAALRGHLDDCESCLRHLRAYRVGVDVYRMSDSPPPFDFFERIQARLDELESPRFFVVPPARESRAGAPDDRSRLTQLGMAAAAAIAFLLVVSQGVEQALSPDLEASSTTGVSIASVIPTLSSAGFVSTTRRVARRARSVARPRSAQPEFDDISTWRIAEVEPRIVRPHPWVVQAALTLP